VAQVLEQGERVGNVVLVVLARVGHRLADVGVGGEVDHRLDPVDEQGVVEDVGVAQVADDQPVRLDGRSMPVDEAVVHPDVVPAGQEGPNRVTADVPGPAGYQDAHRGRRPFLTGGS
jgi:hypothetical protein